MNSNGQMGQNRVPNNVVPLCIVKKIRTKNYHLNSQLIYLYLIVLLKTVKHVFVGLQSHP